MPTVNKHVRVVIRNRPSASFAHNMINIHQDKKTINIHIPKNELDGIVNNQQENYDFKFDAIMHNASQEIVYEDCASPIIKALFEGYNGTIMAYGQTGAGKTFTMTGATENYKHRGIIPRAISQLFREIADRPQLAITVRFSYLEIYNEVIVDLLSSLRNNSEGSRIPHGGISGIIGATAAALGDITDSGGFAGAAAGGGGGANPAVYNSSLLSPPPGGLQVVDDKQGNAHVKDLTILIGNHEEEALNFLFEGETNRSISTHLMNKNSSRSHCIFTIYLESRSRVESSEKVIYSKLNLVDLAGSERLSKTNSIGITLREAMYINKSLTFLEQVIIALSDKRRDHIPYRQSKLTNVLRDALGGNCNTLMIANIWAEKDHIEETISTLRFATRMMCVTNTPHINIQFDPMAMLKKYEREIKELKQELQMHDTLNNRIHVQYEPYSESQRQELQQRIKTFLDEEEDELEIINLRQIREIFSQFRGMYRRLALEHEELMRQVKSPPSMGVNQPFNIQNVSGGGGAPGVLSQSNVTAPQADGGGTDSVAGGNLEGRREDTGVGDVEGGGFGVGHAPSNAKPLSTITSMNAPSASATAGRGPQTQPRRKRSGRSGMGGILESDGDEDIQEYGGTLGERAASSNAISRKPVYHGSMGIGGGYSTSTHHAAQHPIGNVGPGLVVNRSEEFENFKRGKGSEMAKILNENKVTLKEKRKMAKELSELVNSTKHRIDDIKEKLEKKSQERLAKEPMPSADKDIIIDEEEYQLLNDVRILKNEYRAHYESLRQTRSDIEYCSRLVDQCRQKLMAEFELWYEKTYGQHFFDVEGNLTNMEDVFDIGEKFERLQLQRIAQDENPEYKGMYHWESLTQGHKKKALLAKKPKVVRK